MLEKDVEKYLVKRVKEADGIAFKWISPGHNGVPDRICLFEDGLVVFVEVKRPDGRLSPNQEIQIRALKKMHQWVTVVWDKEDVDHLMEDIYRYLKESEI